MRRVTHMLMAACLLAGCQGKSRNFDNPVVGPAPPRISEPAEIAGQDSPPGDEASSGTSSGMLQLTEFVESDEPALLTGAPGQVAARVNGTPIFVADILAPYAAALQQAREKKASERQLRELQLHVIQRDLPQYIETLVLVDAVTSKLDAEQKSSVQKQLDEMFDEQIQSMLKQAGVTTVAELEAALAAAGSSLGNELQVPGGTIDEVRKAFGNKALATQYLKESIGPDPNVSRQELLDEYEAKIKDFSRPARVKWQQVRISHVQHGGPENARRILAQALAELRGGAAFDDVVRKYSDEPIASQGGHWDWTQPDSISDAALREKLVTLAVGQVGDPIAGEKAFLVVKLTGSQAAETTPFEEIQDELRASILSRKREEQIAAVLKDVKSKAVIETMFDGLAAEADRQVSPVSAVKTGSGEENLKN